jgi:hypothetical protein
MVALSLYGRVSSGSSNIHDLRGTTVKLKPRQPVTRLWLDELNDMASIYGCSRVLALAALPTLQNITDAIPMCDMRVATTFYELMEVEWVSENTRLYHLVRKSIDLTGPMQEADLGYITEHFVRGEHRDGKGLLEWLKSHNPSDSVTAQFDLNRKVASASLTAGAPSLIALEAHCTTVLSNWAKLVGDSTDKPAGFYFYLLRSMSEAPDRSKLSALYQWLAGKVSDDASMLSRPDTVIQELVRHGRTLGLLENGSVALALRWRCRAERKARRAVIIVSTAPLGRAVVRIMAARRKPAWSTIRRSPYMYRHPPLTTSAILYSSVARTLKR